MKFKITMKDPDGPYESIEAASKQYAKSIPQLTNGERELVAGNKRTELTEVAGEWLLYGEYITVEIDTDAMTATVIRK